MAGYENPRLPEGINVSPTHPLKEFALLVAGISAALAVAALALSLLAGQLARYVPFAYEQGIARGVAGQLPQAPASAGDRQREAYLQDLADRLARAMDLPADMPLTVHYSPSPTVNALATLGGHIVVFRGLIDTLPSENALAMVIAHEIAHVRHRHPIVALGRGFTLVLLLSAVAGIGDGAVEHWLGGIGTLQALSFSRGQETEADDDALRTVLASYGHLGDAGAFFERVVDQSARPALPALFATHPDPAARIERIRRFAAAHPGTPDARVVALPDFLRH